MRRKLATGMIVLAGIAVCATAQESGSGLQDVPADHWARPAIERVIQRGLLGPSQGRFEGDKPVDRYQLAIVLAKLLDSGDGLDEAGERQQIQNLEALVIEQADELALLGVKLAALEEKVVELMRERNKETPQSSE